jgi:hypothetical protein
MEQRSDRRGGDVLRIGTAGQSAEASTDIALSDLVITHRCRIVSVAATKSELLQRLAKARSVKASKSDVKATEKPSKPLVAPEGDKPPIQREVPADGQRQLAKECAEQAMICGWDKAIQMSAYENRISEHEMRKILDEALEYNDKADPSGRIHELEDWEREKMGRSTLAARSRPS